MNFPSDKFTHMGKTKKDAVIHLIKMMKSFEAEDTLSALTGSSTGVRPKERHDLDSAGNPHEVGVTYQLSPERRGARQGKAGATKKALSAYAKSTIWAAMKV